MRYRFYLAIAAAIGLAMSAGAQPSARGPWTVWKLGDGTAEAVGAFDSKEDALRAQAQCNQTNAQPAQYAYLARREKLDPGGVAVKPPSLKDRRGAGKIDEESVRIEFRDREFVVSGDLSGKGQWSQAGAGVVTLQTTHVIYRGLIDGLKVYGVRYFKDGGQPLGRWAFEMEPAKLAEGPGGHDDPLAVQQIARDEIKAYAAEKGKAVIGVMPKDKDGQGNIVAAVPGTNDRVWDGKTLAGFKDAAAGKEVADATAIDRMGAFLREQFPDKSATIKEAAENLHAKLVNEGEDPKTIDTQVAQQIRDQVKQVLNNSTSEEKQQFFDRYAEKGSAIVQLWRPAELDQIEWYQVPANDDVRVIVRNYQPPPVRVPPVIPPGTNPPPVTSPPATNPPATIPPATSTPDSTTSVKQDPIGVDFAGKIAPIARLSYDETIPKSPASANSKPAVGTTPLPMLPNNTFTPMLPNLKNPKVTGSQPQSPSIASPVTGNQPQNPSIALPGIRPTNPSIAPPGIRPTNPSIAPPVIGARPPNPSIAPPVIGARPPNPSVTLPRPQPSTSAVSSIGATLRNQAAQVQQARAQSLPVPIVRPPEPARAPIYQPTPRERKVETKPGGVIITACAEIDGLAARDASSVSFDQGQGLLTLELRSGNAVTCKLDADDFAVAVRSIFDRKVDPSLSMSYGEKAGYKSVNYCGPLFKTRFGKVMYRADELLGDIIFNREGHHRPVAAGIIDRYEDLVCEASNTTTVGSRVFLRASGAQFAVHGGRLVCRRLETKIDVEGSRYAADYFQESLHRLARAMDERFTTLADSFDEFQEFRGLVQCVALAKWIQRHEVPFDWAALKSRKVAEVEVPALVPGTEWSCRFNGRNLDGWQLSLPTGEMTWSLDGGAMKVAPTGTKTLELLSSIWWKNYDLRYTVVTDGPVEFIVRKGAGSEGAAVTIDTRGRPHKVELFLLDGAWTAVAPGFGTQGTVSVPKELRQPNETGIRVPPGSTLTLYTASLRRR